MNDAAEATIDAAEPEVAEQRSLFSRLMGWGFGIVLTLLYVLVTVNAFGNLIGMLGIAETLEAEMSPFGWFWLILGIAMPVIVYALALLFGRRRSAGVRLFLLLTGLAVISAFQLEILHLVPQWRFFAL